MTRKTTEQQWIVFLSTYPPRECGIATFTASLVRALNQQLPAAMKAKVVAINRSATQHYRYSSVVIDEVVEGDAADFTRLAQNLNNNPAVKAVVIQHEFGLYGGNAGDTLLHFLRTFKKPIITTLHTIELAPKPQYKKVLQEVAHYSTAVVAMNRTAVRLLTTVYNVTTPSIHIIPHGIPQVVPYVKSKEKQKLEVDDVWVLLTFGLLSPDKSIETIIEALPAVIKKFPRLQYFIVGQTHPNLLEFYGESYRQKLQQKVKALQLTAHVKFNNHYLSEQDIVQYLMAADIYIISTLNPQQIVSGTLAYATGAGKAVIATPFLHAKEMAQQGLIRLANFKSPRSFSKAILDLLQHPEEITALEKKVYKATRSATWDNVALSYHNLLVSLGALHLPLRTYRQPTQELYKSYQQLPPIKLDHLRRLTDDYGVIQFAHYHVPDIASGYTTDDVARALIVMCMHWSQFEQSATLKYIELYIQFLERMFTRSGKIYNVVNIKREIDTKHWSADAHGRAVWALGYVVASKKLPRSLRQRAQIMLEKSLKVTTTLRAARSASFSILGLYFYYQAEPRKNLRLSIIKHADHLVAMYRRTASNDWQWFENQLTYSNSKLPEALFYAYRLTKNKTYLDVAQTTLEFLIQQTIIDDMFYPIGQAGWYYRGKHRSYFDQQPVDAASMVRTLIVASRCTKQRRYFQLALIVYQWFLGHNAIGQRLYDESTGGCFDGLGRRSINFNQGAESTIGHLLARLYIEKESYIV